MASNFMEIFPVSNKSYSSSLIRARTVGCGARPDRGQTRVPTILLPSASNRRSTNLGTSPRDSSWSQKMTDEVKVARKPKEKGSLPRQIRGRRRKEEMAFPAACGGTRRRHSSRRVSRERWTSQRSLGATNPRLMASSSTQLKDKMDACLHLLLRWSPAAARGVTAEERVEGGEETSWWQLGARKNRT